MANPPKAYSLSAVQTRRLYRFESSFIEPLDSDVSMQGLRDLLHHVWREERYDDNIRRARCPRLKAGRGMMYNGRLLSFYNEKTHEVVLARNGRKPSVLIHELLHSVAPSYWSHNRLFATELVNLLCKHLGFDRRTLTEQATLAQVL